MTNWEVSGSTPTAINGKRKKDNNVMTFNMGAAAALRPRPRRGPGN